MKHLFMLLGLLLSASLGVYGQQVGSTCSAPDWVTNSGKARLTVSHSNRLKCRGDAGRTFLSRGLRNRDQAAIRAASLDQRH
jgi:hypothetical protein